ncbi:hypothetical protein [Streptomyces alanosinicus]|uniref:Alpha-L-arabinofuranosidase C-terminal domain-containing protein n=1 Tax=Streptomyces alanosinicus TaxID=68171 RepID=A0A918IPF7_9ACTN|nr:hypothetical protein [Streptomyces alanosinicus]GGW24198.1 hypothetical protein GCM10010339_94020 [Streptomyces alanosinicus]
MDAGTSLGTVPSTGVGINTAIYDPRMNDASTSALMKAAGVRQLRYPGGSVADGYHWKTHTFSGGGSWAAPGDDFDHFMATAKKVGAQPIITANYGTGTSDLLNTPAKIAGTTSALRSMIATYAGAHAASVEIAVTETDGDFSPAKTSQAAALFAPDTYMSWFEHGAVNVDWWNVHNGMGTAPTTVNGETDYQDEGVLSSGSCSAGHCEPARDTPFPTYWGIRSLTVLAHPGDTMVKASSAKQSVAVHAVRSRNGGLNVMLINKDPQNTAQVSLSYAGFTPAPGKARTVSYAKGGTALTTAAQGTAATQMLPPYSITTLQLKPSSATTGTHSPSHAAPPAAAAPVASASGTIGTRAQAKAAGAPDSRPEQSNTAGGLACGGARCWTDDGRISPVARLQSGSRVTSGNALPLPRS